jgi:hypothetical protein
MAFPTVQTTSEDSEATATTSHVYTLPASIAVGDLILIVAARGSGVSAFNTLTGWTEIVDDGLANGVTVWARTADGTEGSTVTFTSAASTRSAAILYRISGAEPVATRAPEISTVATGSSTAPNATTVTPTGGAKDYLWISLFARSGEEADDDTWVTSAPTTPSAFSNLLQKACGVAGTNLGGMIAAAQLQSNAASMDAGAFTCATGGWRAHTIAIHPRSFATLERSTAASAATGIATAATFWSIFTGAAASAATGAIATAGEVIHVFARSTAAAATGAVSTAGQRDLLRAAATSATGAISTAPQRELQRSTSADATGAIASDGFAILERSAALAASGAVASAPQRDLLRSTSLAATGDINATGAIEGGFITHTRSASLDATGAVVVAGEFWSTLERAVDVGAVAGIASDAERDLLRSALITASGQVATSSLIVHDRAALLAAVTGISAAPEGDPWTYDPDANWTYSGVATFAYAGGTASTYGDVPDWTYNGG